MTGEEKLALAAAVAQRFAMVDRTNPIHIETFSHVAMPANDPMAGGLDWVEGEKAWTVTAYVGATVTATHKTLPEAIDAFMVRLGEHLRKTRMAHERDAERARAEMAHIDALIAGFEGQVGAGN